MAHEDAHEREQVEAALAEAAAILRRVGVAAICAVRVKSGHTFRVISSPNATEQVGIMTVMHLKLAIDLTDLAKLAAQIGDADGATSDLDELYRRMIEEEDDDHDA